MNYLHISQGVCCFFFMPTPEQLKFIVFLYLVNKNLLKSKV